MDVCKGTSSFEDYEHNVDNLAIEVVGQNWSGEVISVFLEDWEVGLVALSCHLSLDLLCQEMKNVCKGSSKSLDSPRSLFGVPKKLSGGIVTAAEPFFSPWTDCDNKRIL